MKVLHGDNIELLKQYPDNYFDAIVTDAPYGLGKEPNATELMKDWIEKGYHEISGSGFMGKQWDAFVPQPLFWKEVFRVLKHGGHVLSFFGSRTYDWGVMAMRFAGFEVRDCITWHFGSGFPKSHSVSKAIDKMYGAERGIVGKTKSKGIKSGEGNYVGDNYKCDGYDITTPATEQAKKFEGFGSALKPASEYICMARKPLEKGLSIAENVLKWGTGAINIDGCRVGVGAKKWETPRGGIWTTDINAKSELIDNPLGRFPANLILSCSCENEDEHNEDCPIKILDEQSGESKSQKSMRGEGGGGDKVQQLNYRENSLRGHTDKGGASRFFQQCNFEENDFVRFQYNAKASKSERNKGLEGFEQKEKPDNYIMPKLTCSKCGSKRVDSSNTLVCGCNGKTHYEKQNSTESKNNLAGGNKNVHPTVKPIKLMQYLVRLVTPPNGIVLDPFCGSGTTGIACKLEGFQFVGLEQDAEYCKIAQARIDNYVEDKKQSKKIDTSTDDTKFQQPTLF